MPEKFLVFHKLLEQVVQAAEAEERLLQIKTDKREQPILEAEAEEPRELIQFQLLESEELAEKVLLF